MKQPLIGISGTNASGKDSVGLLLQEKNNLCFISVTESLRSEAKRRGLPPKREVLASISAEWRRNSGDLGILVHKAIGLFELEAKHYKGLVIASLRNPGEADTVHEQGGFVVWVDADPKIRYRRIQANNRGRGEEDNKTFEQFLAEEAAEMNRIGDEATLETAAVKPKADGVIINESDNMDDLYADLMTVVQPYLDKFESD